MGLSYIYIKQFIKGFKINYNSIKDRRKYPLPLKGQIWSKRNGDSLYIKEIFKDGRISVSTYHPSIRGVVSGASWCEKGEVWKRIAVEGAYTLYGTWDNS